MAKRGRPAGSENRKKDGEEEDVGIGHNGGPPELTDEQRQSLFFQHLRKVRTFKEQIASATGSLRSQYKAAKADLGDDARKMLEDAIFLDTDEGQAKMEAQVARQAMVARWMGMPLGAQAEMFRDDRTPAEDLAREAGKTARLKGEIAKPPHAPTVPQFQAWMDGWHAADKALSEAQRRDDAVLFDAAEKKNGAAAPAAIGDQDGTHQSV